MRKLIRLAFLAAILPTAPMADPVSDTMEILELWEPKSVTFQDGTLTVILPRREITHDTYTGVLAAGFCLMGMAMSKDFSDVRELVVLNQFARQGYVNENGLADCDRINAAQSGSRLWQAIILGATHLY